MSATERCVAAICARVLGLDRVDPDDDLYDLGGDSIQGVLIALEIERTFRIELPIEIVERSSRVCELSAWVDQATGAKA